MTCWANTFSGGEGMRPRAPHPRAGALALAGSGKGSPGEKVPTHGVLGTCDNCHLTRPLFSVDQETGSLAAIRGVGGGCLSKGWGTVSQELKEMGQWPGGPQGIPTMRGVGDPV